MKIIDKILYYFGYAPIAISHEVKLYAVGKPLETVICRSVFELDDREAISLLPNKCLENHMKIRIKMMLIEKIDDVGLINYTQTYDRFYRKSSISAELRIVKN